MKFRRYCVTVMDNWTLTRMFWTLEGAKRFYMEHRSCANVFKWERDKWQWMCGADDMALASTKRELLFTCLKCEAHYSVAHLEQPVTECPVCGWRSRLDDEGTK